MIEKKSILFTFVKQWSFIRVNELIEEFVEM